MATNMHIMPSQLTAEWSFPEVYEAYYYLRLKYLKDAPGGA